MKRHEVADHTVLNLAARARGIFESSEVDEKRQLFEFSVSELAADRRKPLSFSAITFLNDVGLQGLSNQLELERRIQNF